MFSNCVRMELKTIYRLTAADLPPGMPHEAAMALSLFSIRISLASTGDTRTTSITKTRGRVSGALIMRAPRSRSQQQRERAVSLDILDFVG